VQKSLHSSALWDEVKDSLHKKSGASLSGGSSSASASPALSRPTRSPAHGRALLCTRPDFHGKIEELIFQLKEQYTIVIVTHNMQQAARVAEFTGFFY